VKRKNDRAVFDNRIVFHNFLFTKFQEENTKKSKKLVQLTDEKYLRETFV